MGDLERIKKLTDVHDEIVTYWPLQNATDILTFAACSLMMLPAIAIFFRIVFRAKDKAYFLVIVSLMIVGCCAGISAAYCTMECFYIAKDLKLLLREY